jgi:hypothetical protein
MIMTNKDHQLYLCPYVSFIGKTVTVLLQGDYPFQSVSIIFIIIRGNSTTSSSNLPCFSGMRENNSQVQYSKVTELF